MIKGEGWRVVQHYCLYLFCFKKTDLKKEEKKKKHIYHIYKMREGREK